MVYVKSFLAGVAALIAYVLLMLILLTVYMNRLVPRPASLPDNVGYVSNSPWIPAWLIVTGALLVFTAASGFTYKKFK